MNRMFWAKFAAKLIGTFCVSFGAAVQMGTTPSEAALIALVPVGTFLLGAFSEQPQKRPMT